MATLPLPYHEIVCLFEVVSFFGEDAVVVSRSLAVAAFAALGLALPAHAQNFIVNLTVDGVPVTRSFASQDEALNLLRDSGIRAIIPNYTSASLVTANLTLLGVQGTIVLPPGATTATVNFPGLGFATTISGATRGEVQTNLRQLFEGNGSTPEQRAANQAFVTALRQLVVSTTRRDPVAGHPLSLVGQMAAADFRAATTPIGARPTGTIDRPAGWRFSIGAAYASTSSGLDNRFYSVPVAASYAFSPNGIELFADAPLSTADQGGAQYYQGSLGVGVRVPVLSSDSAQWTIVPQFRAGAAGSDELGTGGYVLGGSVTSDFRMNIGAGYSIQVGNTFAYNETRPIEFDNIKISYELQNQVWRNGVAIGRPLGEVAGRVIHGALTSRTPESPATASSSRPGRNTASPCRRRAACQSPSPASS
jgi:hypothetical protein